MLIFLAKNFSIYGLNALASTEVKELQVEANITFTNTIC